MANDRMLALLLLGLGLAGCSKTTPTEFRQAHRAEGEALGAGLRAVVAAVEAAPEAPIGAPCERHGLTLNKPVIWSNYDDKGPRAGNTELADLDDLRKPEGSAGAGDSYRANLQNTSPLAYGMVTSGPGAGPARAFGRWLAEPSRPGESVIDGKVATTELERAKGVTNFVVTRATHDWGPDGVVRASVYLVEFPAGKVVCGFGVSGSADPNAAQKAYKVTEVTTKGSGEVTKRAVGHATTDEAANTACKAAVDALTGELKKRFDLAIDFGSTCSVVGNRMHP